MNIFLLELFGELGARTHAAVPEISHLVFTELVWQTKPYRGLNMGRSLKIIDVGCQGCRGLIRLLEE